MQTQDEEQPEPQADPRALLASATALRERGDVDGAFKAFLAVVERHRGSKDGRARQCVAEALINLGVLCWAKGYGDEALQFYDRVLADHVDDERSINVVLYNKGIALGAMQRDAEALTVLSRYLERYPTQGEGMSPAFLLRARLQRGLVLARLGRTDAALADLDAALDVPSAARESLAGERAQGMYNRAMILRDAGRVADAVEAFGAMVQEFATSSHEQGRTFAAMAIYNQSLALARVGDPQGSINAAQKMVELFGSERLPAIRERLAKALYSRALLLYHGGRVSDACVAFRQIEGGFSPEECESTARVLAAARRHDLLTVASVNPALYAVRGAGALVPELQAAFRRGNELREAVPAVVTVVHDLSEDGKAADESALTRAEVEQLLSINPEALEALVRSETTPEHRDELNKLGEMRLNIVSQLELHNQASTVLLDYLQKGKPFGLYLRNFQPEGYWLTGHDPGPPPHRVRINVQLASQAAGEAAMKSLPVTSLAVGNPAPVRPDYAYALPRLLLPNEHWQSVVEELIRAAGIVVVEIDRMAPGVLAELAIIERVGREQDTLIIISEASDLSALTPLLAPYGAAMPHFAVARCDSPELASFPHVVVSGEPWPKAIAPLERLSDLPTEGVRWDGVAL